MTKKCPDFRGNRHFLLILHTLLADRLRIVQMSQYWPMRRKSRALNMDSATGLKTPANIPRVRLLSEWLAAASCGPWLQRLSASAGTFRTSIALRVRNNPVVSSWAELMLPYDRLLSNDDLISGTAFGLLPAIFSDWDEPKSRLSCDISQSDNNFEHYLWTISALTANEEYLLRLQGFSRNMQISYFRRAKM